MGRWQPETSSRLQKAAIELFLEQGYDQTTVADIAGRAGLTARTFFRHFTDKREVLFGGSSLFEGHLVQALAAAPESATPLEVVSTALKASGELITDRSRSRSRQSVIDSHTELRERELIKMASLAAGLAEGLRQRGVDDPQAGLAAEAGVAVFRVGFERWLSDERDRSLSEVLDESFAQLRALTALTA
jgi:AcrR family transcriptional regulator